MDPLGQTLLASYFAEVWSPIKVSPAMWLEGDTIIGGTADQLIDSWTDASGFNRHPTGTGAARPVLRLNDLNSKPTVEWGLTATVLNIPNFMSTFTEGTLFIVGKNNVDPGNGAGLFRIGTHFNQNHFPYTDGSIYTDFASTQVQPCGNPAPSLASWYMIAIRSAAGFFELRMNGITPAHFTTASNVVAYNTTPVIGNGGPFAVWAGKTAMFLIVDASLANSRIDKLEGYAAHKYGLQSVLPVGHPYKTVPPPPDPPPLLRINQMYVEVVSSGNPAMQKVRLDQQYLEVVNSGNAVKVRLLQHFIEVIVNN